MNPPGIAFSREIRYYRNYETVKNAGVVLREQVRRKFGLVGRELRVGHRSLAWKRLYRLGGFIILALCLICCNLRPSGGC